MPYGWKMMARQWLPGSFSGIYAALGSGSPFLNLTDDDVSDEKHPGSQQREVCHYAKQQSCRAAELPITVQSRGITTSLQRAGVDMKKSPTVKSVVGQGTPNVGV